MENRYTYINSLAEIEEQLVNDSFIEGYANDLLNLIEKSLDPYEDKAYSYDLNQATIVGLYTKLYKYYKLIILSYNEKIYETTLLFQRPLYEAFVLLKYLILKGEESQRHYRLVSYRRRYNNLKEQFEGKKEFEGVIKVLLDKLSYAMGVDGFSTQDFENENLKKGRKWELDGKNFSEIHREVEIPDVYRFVYGNLSEIIHSGWGEIRQFHLNQLETDYFVPKIDFYDNIDIRMIVPVFSIMIEAAEQFLYWADRDDEVDSFKEAKKIENLLMNYIHNNYQTNPERYKYE